jgi:6-phosphogluconolactonase (cycloisomerase 2 family)
MTGCGGGGGSAAAATSNPDNPNNPDNPDNPTHASISISGVVTGLATGVQVSLENNATDQITVSNGMFTFPKLVPYKGNYSVVVKSQPAGYICSVNNGAGSQVTAKVTNISVTCNQLGYHLSGTVSGLTAGKQLTLLNNNADPLTITANGTFTFTNKVAKGSAYLVTIDQQPVGLNCSIDNNVGYDLDADVATVRVNCSATSYRVGGFVTGLDAGKQLTLLLNHANPVTITENGIFDFSTKIASGGNVTVSVQNQPQDQICSISNNSVNSLFSTVSNVKVMCSKTSYSISGWIVGLDPGASLTILNNNADPLTLTTNGSFTFSTPVANDSSYSVTINKQPNNQICSVANYTANHLAAPVDNVTIVCNKTGYTISGTISGLRTGTPSGPTALIARLLNNDGDPLIVDSDGAFTFASKVALHQGYTVTLQAQPLNKFCTVTNGSGSDVTSNVINVQVNCNPYTGSLTALSPANIDFPGSGIAAGVATTPDGKYLYAAGKETSYPPDLKAVAQYAIGTNGTLSLLTPSVVDVGIDPTALAITPNGKYAYVINARGQSVSQLAIAANGKLTALTPASIMLAAQPADIIIAPNGKNAYVTQWNTNSIMQYAISNTGQLVALTPDRSGSGKYYRLAITPDGQFVYASYYDNDCVSTFKVESDGRLTEVGSCTAVGDFPKGMVVTPDRRYLLVANSNSKSVSRFAINNNGSLTLLGTTPLANILPSNLVITPDGQFVYVSSENTSGLKVFTLRNGDLSLITDLSTAGEIYRGVVTPNGQYIYFGSGDIYQYRLY